MGERNVCQTLSIIPLQSPFLVSPIAREDPVSRSITMISLSNMARGLAALTLAALPAVQASYPSPGACKGSCWAHDPALIKRTSDGTYFRFNTGSEIGIYKADSLEGEWTYEGSAIKGGSSIDLAGNTDLWVSSSHLTPGSADGCLKLHFPTALICSTAIRQPTSNRILTSSPGAGCSLYRRHILHVLRRLGIW